MFKKFIGDREGNFAIATAIGMIPILAGVGLSIDYADSVRSASNLQNALDSALVEIATNAPQGYSESELEKMGDEYFQSNLVSASAMAGVLDYLGVTAGSKGSLTFTGKGSTTHKSFFSEKFNTDIVRWSAVIRAGGDPACVLSLSDDASSAINLAGNTTALLDGCMLASNSRSSTSIVRTGSAEIDAACVQTVGGTSGLSSSYVDLDCGSVREHSFRTYDPLEDVVPPSTAGSQHLSFTTVSGVKHLSPGVYNDNKWNINVENVVFEPGTYVFVGTQIKVTGNAIVAGAGVTIFLMDGASIDIAANATVNLVAPTTGTYKGILFFVDRDEEVALKFAGGADSVMTGFIYNPGGSIEYAGNDTISSGECVRVVGNTVKLTGNSTFKSSCASELGGNEAYTVASIRFVR